MKQDGWSTHSDLEDSPGMKATQGYAYDAHTAARHCVLERCKALSVCLYLGNK